MIYYVVGINENHDEAVLSTHSDAESATQACERYKKIGVHLSYRIDTVPSDELATGIIQVLDKTIKGIKYDLPPVRVHSSWPFTVAELFPPKNNIPSSNCVECGAYVTIPWQTTHTTWHNKVADL